MSIRRLTFQLRPSCCLLSLCLLTGTAQAGDSGQELLQRSIERVLQTPEQRDAAPLTVTEAQALALALDRASSVAQARQAVTVAQQGIKSAVGVDPLELRYDEGPLNRAVSGDHNDELGLRIHPPHPLQLMADVGAARAEVQVAEAALLEAEQEVREEVLTLLAGLRVLDAQLDAARRSVQVGQQRLELVQKRVENQTATRLDLAVAHLDHAEAAARVTELEGQQRTAHRQLAGMLGVPTPQHLSLSLGPVVPAGSLPSERAMLELALKQQARLRGAVAEVDLARAARKQASVELMPSLSFVQLNRKVSPDPTENETPWTLSASVDIPIPGFSFSGRPAAKAQERAAALALDQEVRAVAREVGQARERLVQALALLEAFDAGPGQAIDKAGTALEQGLAAKQVELDQAVELAMRRARLGEKRTALLENVSEARLSLELLIGPLS